MLQEKYFNKLEEIKEPLECLIQEIKDKVFLKQETTKEN